jgi:nucleoid DNA-binding protein
MELKMKYISELLFENDCVIIPGLGGFVATYQPARIENDNKFIPPYKKITFNKRLSSNDGLLAHHISSKENINYQQALTVIENFVKKSRQVLEQQKKVRFPEIGILSLDENGRTRFQQEEPINYLAEAYGLNQFQSPPIFRQTYHQRMEKRLKKNPVASMKNQKIRNTLRWAAVLVPIALVGSLSFIYHDTITTQYQKFTSLIKPVSQPEKTNNQALSDEELVVRLKKQNEKTYQLNKGSFLPTTSQHKKTDANAQPVAAAETTQKTQPVVNNNTKTTDTKENYSGYHIITGSFLEKAHALNHMEHLKNLGYSPILLPKEGQTRFYRISAMTLKQQDLAYRNLHIIKNEDFAEAWLLKL